MPNKWGRGVNNTVESEFSRYLISRVLINGEDRKSKNYLYIVNARNEYKQATAKINLMRISNVLYYQYMDLFLHVF